MGQEEKDKELYFVSVKNPTLSLSAEYEEFIATSEDFKTFCNEVLDIEVDSDYDNFILRRYVRAKRKVKFIAETFNENKTARKLLSEAIENKKNYISDLNDKSSF